MKKNTPAIAKKKEASVKEYVQVFADIKKQILEAQVKAVLSANRALLLLCWHIGKTIAIQQQVNGWGASTIDKLAEDIQKVFPGIGGFSPRNISRMRAFFLAYENLPQTVAKIEDLPVFNIPWGHNALIIEKVKNIEERLWYAQKTIEDDWSRNALEGSIKSNLYRREGKAITNFTRTLPIPQSSLAQQSLKDPYIFDFLTLHNDHIERDVEQGLIDNVQKLLVKLGKGFAFVGRQYRITVDSKSYYIDLLFYHYKLRCFIVVELKANEFEPRDAGQLNFYLSVVDDQLRAPSDNQTIGILLCKTKSNITAEYALRDINKPIGIASYEAELINKLPKELKSSLPTIEEIEEELAKSEAELP